MDTRRGGDESGLRGERARHVRRGRRRPEVDPRSLTVAHTLTTNQQTTYGQGLPAHTNVLSAPPSHSAAAISFAIAAARRARGAQP